jgi:DNA polymerase III subunit alpha
MKYSHLHCHTQYSLLDGAADIGKLFKKAVADEMPAIAITDHGNMFGAFEFVAEAAKHKGAVKAIVGCEFYMVEDRHIKQFTKEKKDKRYHQLFLAKNEEGYKNLAKMCSLGFIEGLYSKWPRIDKELVLKYHKGLIATTCCLGAEVPQAILREGEAEAEKKFKWWLDIFGEDYYVELQRHRLPDQEKVNEVLLRFAAKYNVKIICSNDSHYVENEDANAHDILLCVNTGDLQSTPKATDEEGGKGYRFGFPNDQFYFKTTKEMAGVFHDLPQALDNTNEIVGKIDQLQLKRDILLPNFPIEKQFQIHADDVLNQWEYLKHLTYKGGQERYGEVTGAVQERIDFELHTIRTMGFAGYFLIVADFIKAGRDLGVYIGPGRGSAAGSAVAYCTGITNIDPIKYNLLFERFLNPDRKSMPDIDTDFDDEGRQKVIDYVVQKYGKNQVAQIITYGTMAAKSSIKDVSRVMDLPLAEANALAKLVPEKPGTKLNKIMTAKLEDLDFDPDVMEGIKQLREIHKNKTDPRSHVLTEALKLEGSVRNVGIHAAGIIIAPSDLTDLIPVTVAKDAELLVTQFEGKIIEDAGVIKMDFLGLKNLTIIRDCLAMIKQRHGITLDIETITLEDQATYELYQRAETNGTFQFESPGMQKYLRELKPDKFEDLIAMNALYRPGPLAYIPNFIARKHGREAITYDLPEMEEYLSETYGINVYQEQIMLLSQKLGNFTKGDADVLRKAMGKKQIEVLNKMKGKFMEGCTANGHDLKICEKVWGDWEAFAQYAFNKSHSTCYARVAYQTAYLKAHYAAEYMAAILTHSKDMTKIEFALNECRAMGLEVLGPDVNESDMNFTVNKKGQIRFGMSSIKGVGEGPVAEIIIARKDKPFTSIWDLVSILDSKNMNKRVLEGLIYGGGLDCFGAARAQYFAKSDKYETLIEHALKWGAAVQHQASTNVNSLFGEATESVISDTPRMPLGEEWGLMEKLQKEKDVVGLYLSGHPLDDYREEIKTFTSCSIPNLERYKGQEVKIAGIVSEVRHGITKKGTGWGAFKIQDFEGTLEIAIFNDDYIKFSNYFEQNQTLFITGKYMPKWNDPNLYDLRLNSVELLAGVSERLISAITISLNHTELTERLITDLYMLCTMHPGKHKLQFKLDGIADNTAVNLASKTVLVNINDDLRNEVKRLGLEYTLR